MLRAWVVLWPCLLLLVILPRRGACFSAGSSKSRTSNPAVDDVMLGTWVQGGGQPEIAVPSSSVRQAERLANFNYLLQPGSSPAWLQQHGLGKRDPLGINARGFHEDVFNRDYGSFHPMRKRHTNNDEDKKTREKRSIHTDSMSESKRRPEMDSAGFYGDTFSNGYGEFWPLKKRWAPAQTNVDAWRKWYKRKPEMDSSGFFGDTFSNGFGDFWTMKKKSGHNMVDKRRPEMDSAGFYGDTFSNGFGDFWTVKKKYNKRRPEMDSAGFYGDTFSNGFGDFWTVKKRAAEEETHKTNTASVNGAAPDPAIASLQTEGEATGQ